MNINDSLFEMADSCQKRLLKFSQRHGSDADALDSIIEDDTVQPDSIEGVIRSLHRMKQAILESER